jgi:hypothetical protein
VAKRGALPFDDSTAIEAANRRMAFGARSRARHDFVGAVMLRCGRREGSLTAATAPGSIPNRRCLVLGGGSTGSTT